MHVRLHRRADPPIVIELVAQLGYDVHPPAMAEGIDLVLVNDTRYAAAADDGHTIVGLVYAYKRSGLQKPIETVVSSSIAYGKDPALELLMVAVSRLASKARSLSSFTPALTETMRTSSSSASATPISPPPTS